jgi:hypothetical protein
MARFLMNIVLAMIATAPARAQDVPFAVPHRPNSAATRGTVATLGDIMGKIQWRHIKLWKAIENKNWPLVNYEVGQMRDSFLDAALLYHNIPAELVIAADQPLVSIQEGAKSKDLMKSKRGYANLTAACNSCHQAGQVGFIRIESPSTSPFSDQKF